MKRKGFIKKFTAVILVLSLTGVLIIGGIFVFMKDKIDFSSDERMFECNRRGNVTKIYCDSESCDSEYTPIEYAVLKPDGDSKIWYSYSEIGENIKNAFISVEDRNFFSHKGVDVKRTILAFLNVFTKSKPSFGASTITQQVIKNISGDNEKTLTRKFAEIIRAKHIEKRYSKEEIFEVYLNIVPMGDSIGGVGLASKHYFGKEPSELTLAEAATITGITNAPSKYNPRINPEAAKDKRNSVLYAMLDNGVIREEEYQKAKDEPLIVLDNGTESKNSVYSWFTETVISDATASLSKKMRISENAARVMIQNGGYSIYSTVNTKIQEIIEGRFENLDEFPEAVKEGLNYSMVVSDSKNGNLLGIVGGVGKKGANRIINYATTNETPGSVLKPLALYAPLINSGKITWSTVFDDTPISFTKSEAGEYIPYPKNYPNVYDGLTTVSDALRVSKNTVAVKLYNISDKRKIYSLLYDTFGFDSITESVKTEQGKTLTDLAAAPLALGQLTYGVSLRKLTEAYTVFPREGEFEYGKSFLYISDHNGDIILDNTGKNANRVFSVKCARIMNQMLSEVTDTGTAKLITLDDTIDTAGKTGTSGNDKDRMFIGYTPYYTAGIWCGYEKNDKGIGSQSISHIEIWDEVMKEIHEECVENEVTRSFSTDGLVYLPYCKDSGEKIGDTCMLDPRGDRTGWGYFEIKNRPNGTCTRHIEFMYDELAGAVAIEGCPHEYLTKTTLLDIPDRSFISEIIITDAQYVYREMKGEKYGDSYDIPYFYYEIPDGEYVGRSKGKKQYNSSCYIHKP